MSRQPTFREDNTADTRLNISSLIRFQLRLVASILLMSVRADCWPYHEIVDTGKSAPVYVPAVYEAAPALSLLPIEAAKDVGTVVTGPVTAITFIEGSSSGPVTILTSGSPDSTLQNTSSPMQGN